MSATWLPRWGDNTGKHGSTIPSLYKGELDAFSHITIGQGLPDLQLLGEKNGNLGVLLSLDYEMLLFN